ncbi:MAG: replication factor C large subunit [Hadesarchaea archaeon]|nr:replication factor C large subunit [Hadesarchaea archaeon]
MAKSWTGKYRPERLKEVAAQGRAMKSIKKWIKKWRKGKPKKKALLFYGPPGVGKSATAAAIANKMDWDLIELNASDTRTRKEIERIAGSAANMGSLTGSGGKRLIVLDEADNVHGNADRGGNRAISKLLKETNNPVILIGNDRYEMPRGIRNKSEEINFRRLRKDSIAKVLRRIAKEEGINADPRVLKELGERANGDLRSAINDFQAIAEGKEKVSMKDLTISSRDREINIFKVLGKLKKIQNAQEARKVLWDLDQPPDDTIDWIEDNIPNMYSSISDIAGAYEALSRADIFLGRAKSKQIYGLWGYASDLMSAGVALARKDKPARKRFGYPTVRKRLGRSKKKRSTRDSLSKKIAEYSHTSSETAIKEYIPHLSLIFKENKKAGEEISRKLELEKEEIDYLKKF